MITSLSAKLRTRNAAVLLVLIPLALAAACRRQGGPNDTTMHRYAFAYSDEEAETHLKRGANVNGRDPEYGGQTPLHKSAGAGAVGRMELFLRYGADVNARDDRGSTPLHAAATFGQSKAVAWLLLNGADPLATDGGDNTVLHALVGPFNNRRSREHDAKFGRSSNSDFSGTAQLLVSRGIDVNARNRKGQTALHQVAEGGWQDVMDLFLANGGDLSIRDHDGQTPWGCALRINQFNDEEESRRGTGNLLPSQAEDYERMRVFVRRLGERYSSESRADDEAAVAAHREAEAQEMREFLRGKGEPPAKEGEHSETAPNSGKPAQVTATSLFEVRDAATAETLLAAGAKVNARDEFGQSPLHVAAGWGRAEAARVLIEHGAPVDEPDRHGRTPLCGVIIGRARWEITKQREPELGPCDFTATARILLDKGAAVDGRDQQGKTPLHLAAERGDVDVVRLLVDHGADPKVKDHQGGTPLHSVASGRELWSEFEASGPETATRFRETAALLLARGADVNAIETMSYTPLHLASVFCDPDVAQVLIEQGADIGAKSQRGETPLACALRGQRTLEQLKTRISANELADKEARFERLIASLREGGATE